MYCFGYRCQPRAVAWPGVLEGFLSTADEKPTDFDVIDWAKRGRDNGAGEIVLNVMNADGTLDGYDLEMTQAVAEAVDIPVVASGGAGNLQHLADVLTTGKADAALAASIFHFGTYTIGQAKDFLKCQRYSR